MYKRIILKLSGEALSGEKDGVAFDNEIIGGIVKQIKTVLQGGTEIGLIIGGGNFWRGRSADSKMDRTKADQVGMLATVMNAIYVADFFRQEGIEAHIQTPFKVGSMTDEFNKDKALKHMKDGHIVIFAGGIGHPFFSTDTTTALRGAEMEAEVLLFAKNVDGVYDSDPAKNPDAKKIDEIYCGDIITKGLRVIDLTAASICFEQKIPVLIFGLNEENSIIRAVSGEKIGTVVKV